MSDEATTKPTLETVLERINAVGDNLASFRQEVENRFDSFREEVGIRLDRIEGVANQTRAEMMNLRADFRELRLSLKESA